MSALPSRVKVIGKTFRIKRSPKMKLFGEMDQGKQLIRIGDGQVRECERDSVWHELTHAIEKTLGLDLKERQVYALACAQMQVMTENPELMRYLVRKP